MKNGGASTYPHPVGRDNPIDGIADDDDTPPDFSEEDEADTDAMEVEENPDGSATVTLEDDEPERESSFGENLAEFLEESVLSNVARELLDAIERDKEDRKGRDKLYAQGIKATGIGEDAPGGADFEGAARATHPMLAEGCVDFAARAMKELFPAKGPCRTYIVGEATRDKIDRAERKKDFMNWQLTTQIREYRGALEQCLTQVPLGGSQFIKAWPDPVLKRPRVEPVYVDNILLPFAATDFYTAERVTNVQYLTQSEYDARVNCGMYRDVGSVGSALLPEQTDSAVASDMVEGREDGSFNEDGLRTVYEIYTWRVLDGDTEGNGGNPVPYIITVDDSTSDVLAVYRNWAEGDEKFEKLDWLIEFGMIPWRGALKIGLAHLLGGLSGAATGALRALLDSAQIANFPGGLAMQTDTGSLNGQSVATEPGTLTSIKAPVGIDDIRKVAMPFPFPGPSSVLFQLLEWLTQHGSELIATGTDHLGDTAANAPVGSTLAMIEQDSITYSAIHGRLHESQKRLLSVIHRINGDVLDDETTIEELGELTISRQDFEGPMDIIPVSDPSIFSDAQRYAQLQAVMGLAGQPQYAQFFKQDVLVRRAMQLLNFPQMEEVLATPGDPKKRDPIQENVAAREANTCLKAYKDQDHLTHLALHVQFMGSPIYCANPGAAMPAMPALLAHCQEHISELYLAHAEAAMAAAKKAVGNGATAEDVMHDAMIAVDQELSKALAPIMQGIQQAQKFLQSMQPSPQQDPSVQRTQMQIQADQQKQQAEAQQEQAMQQAENQQQLQLASMEQSAENQRHQQEMAIAARNADVGAQAERDSQIQAAYSTQVAEVGANQRTAMTNETNLEMAQMKGDLANYQQRVDRLMDLLETFMNAQQPQTPPTPTEAQ